MTTALLTIIFRGARRVRLIFTGALASGAFASTGLYAFASADGAGASPINVVAVFAVTSTSNAVELAIDSDLAGGLQYTVTCTAVPCADLSSFTGSLTSQVGQSLAAPPNVEPAQSDIALLLYSRDLLHNGVDFVEDATGDLATVAGQPNWQGAMGRRFGSYGLPWDSSYGPRPDEFVDAPQTYQLPFAGSLVAQARLDDRTKQASVVFSQDTIDPGSFYFAVSLTGRDNLQTVTVNVPLPA